MPGMSLLFRVILEDEAPLDVFRRQAIVDTDSDTSVQFWWDGAHAVGAIPLDIPSLGVQYYTSNLHKWGCCPKSAAFLWVHKELQSSVVPLVTSHGYKTVCPSYMISHTRFQLNATDLSSQMSVFQRDSHIQQAFGAMLQSVHH